ncbi:hypothetical protein LXL04_015245 [Taraxacum kok-saghyz]
MIESLTSTLRQGWLELSSARHSMGGSRLNTVLLTLKHHSAPTTVELDYDNGSSNYYGPLTRARSKSISSLVSKPNLVMATPSDDVMKKLEAFMLQQTESTKNLKESNDELRAAMKALQNKQDAIESGLHAQSQNKSHKNREEEESENYVCMEEVFDDPPETGRGRGRGTPFDTDPNSKGVFRVFGRGGPPKFKHNWQSLKPEGSNRREHESPKGGDDWEETGYRGSRVPRFAKIEFPTYDGKGNPVEWLQRCEDFFEEQQTPVDAWVRQATFSLQGKASGWYHNLRRMRTRLNWVEFSEECNIRFGPPRSMNPLGELTRLRQTGSVEDYCEGFESLLGRTKGVTPEQSIWHFCAGLMNIIRYEVEFARPTTLYYAINLARQIELKLSEEGRPRSFGAPPANKSRSREATMGGSGPVKAEPRNPTFKRLTAAEMAERRSKGLYFNCDEMFSIGHKCAKLFCIMITDEEDTEEYEEDTPAISLNAIKGEKTDQTFQVRAKIGNGIAWVLLDSGSTHNFIAARTAEQLGVTIQHRPGLRVALPDGGRMASSGISKNLPIEVQGYEFHADVFAIPLEGFDIVLGIRWLQQLGRILWDFTIREMEFTVGGKNVKWVGESPEAASLSLLNSTDDQEPNLEGLLDEFEDIFRALQGLPPSRHCDHRIRLKPNTEPVAVRPYRYPHLLKDEIEKQCTEMLQNGTIRPSQSPFSSPVLLVKKHDNSWRFCVDYRELNSKTVKDKFPIPLVDELHGATIFTKLDLTSGYHQVRMCQPDIEKTAFRTHHGHFEFLVMPFGLSNAPSTFQSLMNEVFHAYLRKYVLVFFDDILVYSRSTTEHVAHLRSIFELLRAHQLCLKRTKCTFGSQEVAYLGHIVNASGVSVDQTKIEAIREWPKPHNVRTLQGFLGLTGYYRKFIQDYGIIAGPLTSMLRRNKFLWGPESELAFGKLKDMLSNSPVLALPDFTTDFVVECDASGSGIGAILQQQGHPVAFFSRKLADRHHKLPAYERELIGLAKAVAHWRPYLWGRHFRIKTDHYSLKFLLDQRLTSSPQQHWVSKLLGFDFTVEYRAGTLNRAADALSRRDADVEEGELFLMSDLQPKIFDSLQAEIESDGDLLTLRDKISRGEEDSRWAVQDGLITYDGRVYLKTNSPLVDEVVSTVHNSAHEGVQKTMERIRSDFYWRGWKSTIQAFIKECVVCQRNKWETLQPAGLLQPLPIPETIWSDISMDFVEALPKVAGKSVLLVVVDQTIVTDRDKVFQSNFWKELFRLSGSQLSFTTAYHPQSDGQTEFVNRTIEMYLWCLTGDKPRKWLAWLPWAEYYYNTSYHTALKTTPFKLVYGRDPPKLLNYVGGHSKVEAVDQMLIDRTEFLATAKIRLAGAQQRMKVTYDSHHRSLEFQEGDWVWLKLQPYRQLTVAKGKFTKLSPQFYGPFQVLQRIGAVAYRLALPEGSRVHNVFHVSLLKPHQGMPPDEPTVLPPLADGKTLLQPYKVLQERWFEGVPELLVQWVPDDEDSATWEKRGTFVEAYPDYELEDKLKLEEGSNDMGIDPKYGKISSLKEATLVKSTIAAGSMTKSKAPQLTLSKWKSSDKKDSTQESNESEATESPLKTENHLQKERGKVLSMFGGMVSPKLRDSQLSFETALETLVEIANVRSSILEAHRALILHKG